MQHTHLVTIVSGCALGLLACGEPANPLNLPIIEPYAPLGTPADCSNMPELCDLHLEDLGGGTHDHAHHLVFVGDGYGPDDLWRFEVRANALRDGLTRHPGGVVAANPALFHFWRLDVPSRSPYVDDDDLVNTPLGAHLSPPDICGGTPLIQFLGDRVRLALAAASTDDGQRLPLDQVTPVLLSRDSTGRANASYYGSVRMRSTDSLTVLRHELGHALFRLGDEYEEFRTCAENGFKGLHEGPGPLTERAFVVTPNVTAHEGADKWERHVDSHEEGGARWPCLFHPTESCLMLGNAETLCPVCAATAAEHIAHRRCEADAHPPAVAIADEWTLGPGQSHLVLYAEAYDERVAVDIVGWRVDGEGVASDEEDGPFGVFDLSTLEPGVEIRAQARDASGNKTTSPPFVVPTEAFPHIEDISLTPSPVGGHRLSAQLSQPFALLDVPVGDDVWSLRADATGAIDHFITAPLSAGDARRTRPRSLDGRVSGRRVDVDVLETPDNERPPPMLGPVMLESSYTALLTSTGEAVEFIESVAPVIVLDVHVSTCTPLTRVVVRQDDVVVGHAIPSSSAHLVPCEEAGETFRVVHVVAMLHQEGGTIDVEIGDQRGRTAQTEGLWSPVVDPTLLDEVDLRDGPPHGLLNPLLAPPGRTVTVRGPFVAQPTPVFTRDGKALYPARLGFDADTVMWTSRQAHVDGHAVILTTKTTGWDSRPPVVYATPSSTLVLDDREAIVLDQPEDRHTLDLAGAPLRAMLSGSLAADAITDIAGNPPRLQRLLDVESSWPLNLCGAQP